MPSAIEALGASGDAMPRRWAVRTIAFGPTSSVRRTETVFSECASARVKRHRPEVFAGVVFRPPALDGDRPVVADRVGGQPALERREIDERLERGAGLALGGDGAVERALGVVAAADHGAHGAVRRHRDEGALADAELLALLRRVPRSAPSRPAACSAGSIVVSTTMSCSTRPIRSFSTSMTQSAA